MVVFVAQWLVGFGSPCRIVVSVFVSGFTGFICLLTKAELMGTEDISLTCKICKIRVNVRLRTNLSDRKRPNGGCTVECAGYEWIIGRTKTLPWIRKNQLKSSWVWLQLWKLQFKSLLEVIANANQFEDTRSVKPKHCRLVRPTFAFYMLQTSRNFSLSSHAMGVNSQSNRDVMTTITSRVPTANQITVIKVKCVPSQKGGIIVLPRVCMTGCVWLRLQVVSPTGSRGVIFDRISNSFTVKFYCDLLLIWLRKKF